MGPDAATLPSPRPGTPRHPRGRAVRPVACLAAALAGAVLVASRAIRRVEVAGGSMAPTFLPGDRLVVWSRPLGPPLWPAVGDVVAVADPRVPTRTLVKRVAAVDRATGTLDVRGDDPGASTDSREFGPVPLAALVGRAVYRYGPKGRTGPGPWPKGYDRA
jgi:nickel-type superoxide dismutase maturation protease